MNKGITCFLLIIINVILMIGAASSQVPPRISYQGMITNAAGTPADGVYSLDFTIFTTPTGGSGLWSEGHPAVAITNGVFSVELGSFLPLNLPFSTAYYLEIAVNGIVLVPRIAFATVPYSFVAKTVVDNGISSEKIANGAVTASKLAPMGASAGQSIVWDGNGWKAGDASEADPIYSNSAAGTIQAEDISRWNSLASSPWIVSGSKIYYNSGNVGIGVASPAQKLDVDGSINISDGNSLRIGAEPFVRKSGQSGISVGRFALGMNTSGSSNIAIGESALLKNTETSNLVAIGDSALMNNGFGSTYAVEGSENTAVGSKSLSGNTIGYENTAIGFEAIKSNVDGYENTAVGAKALQKNINGHRNTALGGSALVENLDGGGNTGIGFKSMEANTHGAQNTAVGNFSLVNNRSGNGNTAIGTTAMQANSDGSNNTAIGFNSLFSNNVSPNNTAIGSFSMFLNQDGAANVAVGSCALYNSLSISELVAIGDSALFQNGNYPYDENYGRFNTAVGAKALRSNTTGYFNTALGHSSLNPNFSIFT